MPVVPTGAPAWTRTASYSIYGGHTDKQNYLSRGVIDALTDLGAEEYTRAASDLAAAVRTSPAFIIRFTTNDSVPDEPTVHSVLAMIGVNTTGYSAGAAPGSFPGGDRNGAGDVSFHFLTAYEDEYGISDFYTPTSATVTAETPGIIATALISGQSIQVVFVDDGANPAVDQTATLVVW